MGVVLFTAPKKNALVDFFDDLWLAGLFSLSHGLHEWVDLLIMRRGRPFHAAAGDILNTFLLPLSFLFLLLFSTRLIARLLPAFKSLRFLWIVSISFWGFPYFITGDTVVADIMARYFICLPAVWLSVFALILSFLKIDRDGLPKIVTFSFWTGISVAFLYGILSGLIVPAKGILLSPFINEEIFLRTFGMPVQFFRMLCALVFMAAFFGVAKVYTREDGRVRFIGGIRRKLSLTLCMLAIIFGALGIAVTYTLGFTVMCSSIGEDYMHVTKVFNIYIAQLLEKEIVDLQTAATRVLWVNEAKKGNLIHAAENPEAAERRWRELDESWLKADPDSPLVRPYLENAAALSLKGLLALKGSISELIITDRFGGVVAASEKTGDFYQADETWWQAAYDRGRGAVYVGEIKYDPSLSTWILSIAVPVRDTDKSIVGICKSKVNISVLLKPLEEFKIGRTGHIFLVNSEGQVLFHKGTPFSRVVFSDQAELQHITKGASGYKILYDLHSRRSKLFIAFSKLILPTLSAKGVSWFVFIEQDAGEAFEDLGIFIGFAVLSLFLLIVAILPIGYFLGSRFVKPISDLHLLTQEVRKGNWDYSVDIGTGDEIEQFANTFRDMIADIRFKQRELIAINKEIEALAQSLEGKVAERTRELSQVNEATLNILEDLTQSKAKLDEYARELERALAVKTEFTSMVSHELRTPLAAIKEGIAIVMDGSAGGVNPQQKEFLVLAKRNVDRLARLIDDILDFQKLDSGRMDFELRQEDIYLIINEVYQTMVHVAGQKSLEFGLSLEKDLPPVLCDRDKITQVLTNLVNNAIKFTDHGRIDIMAKRGDNSVEVEVRDTGIGIRTEDLPKLFQRFSQLADGNDRRTGGSGLGLAISREIIEMHKGKLWVESKQGEGSSFFFILPIHERRV